MTHLTRVALTEIDADRDADHAEALAAEEAMHRAMWAEWEEEDRLERLWEAQTGC